MILLFNIWIYEEVFVRDLPHNENPTFAQKAKGHVYSDKSRILPPIHEVFRGKQQAILRTDQLNQTFIDSIELLGSQAATRKTRMSDTMRKATRT